MRHGMSEGIMLEAIAKMAARRSPKSRANMLRRRRRVVRSKATSGTR